MNPNRVNAETVTDPEAALNRGLANRATSSMGLWLRRSQETNPAQDGRRDDETARLRTEPQLASGASMMV